MNYVTCIQRTLDYIEENLETQITLEKLAEIACFSPFHYHRVFQAMVGESVMNYVRKRRLTRAAERLFFTDEKVIDIALDVGFQYQESFNRAFKKFYDVSPKQYRNARRISGPLRGKAYLTITLLSGGNKMEPKLVTKPAFYVIGYELKTKNEGGQNNKDIPEFWQQYMQNGLGSKIPNPLHQNQMKNLLLLPFSPHGIMFLQNGSLNQVMSTTDQWNLNCMTKDAMVRKTKRLISIFL